MKLSEELRDKLGGLPYLTSPHLPASSALDFLGENGEAGSVAAEKADPIGSHHHYKGSWNSHVCWHSSTSDSSTPPCSEHSTIRGVLSLKTPEKSWLLFLWQGSVKEKRIQEGLETPGSAYIISGHRIWT